jgi:SpoIIAA-like
MIEQLQEMPPGVVGMEVSGRITGEDYVEVLVPAFEAAIEAGSLRAVVVIGPKYEGFDLSAVREDLKGLVPLAFEHRDTWKRVAAVTDEDWLVKAVEVFGRLMPGEVRVFDLDELEQAKRWAAADGSEAG